MAEKNRMLLPSSKGIRRPGQGKKQEVARPKEVVRRRSTKKQTVKNKSKLPQVIIFLIFLICLVFLSSFMSYTYLVDKYNNPISVDEIFINPETMTKFRIERGASTKQIAHNLKELDLIKNTDLYRFLSKFNGFDGQYKAGTYTLSKGLTYDEIMNILSSNPESVKVTFPEGFTTEQIAARLEANEVCSSKEFLRAIQTIDVSSYPFIKESQSRDYRLDGFLFPDTYEFDVDAEISSVIYKMLNRFNEVFKPLYYDIAAGFGMTVDEVVILASIVEREVKVPAERVTVSGVFHNRLNSQDPDMAYLQSCATVRYAYKKLYNETLEGDITEEHEQIQDPYNTYRAKGLPPGPICNPGLASIEATLRPEKHNYLYFVLKKDNSGAHNFSRTYQEHLNYKNG